MEQAELLRLYRAFYVIGDQSCLKILHELERYGERNFSELRDRLAINPATLSKKLKLLTQFDFIIAAKSRDNLRVYYQLHEHRRGIKRILESIERLAEEL